MNNLDKQYQELLQDILDNGVIKGDRTGTGTISVFGRQIRHKMSEGFPLLTTKKMPFKIIAIELLWFLRGDTNIKFLVDNNCHIWDGDCYKNFVAAVEKNRAEGYTRPVLTQEEFINNIKKDNDFAKKWGDLGPIYGKQWRSWGGELVPKRIKEEGKIPYSQNVLEGQIDQIQNLIKELKTNPDSRRLMVNAWNVGVIDQMVLPPCHYGFQLYTRELSGSERAKIYWSKKGIEDPMLPALKAEIENANIPTRAISLMWNQRSVDTFLGLPFNIASYGLLLEIIAKEVNMVPDELIGNLGDTHLYSNHIEQAKEQIGRELSEDERYDLCAAQKSKMTAISEEDYIKYNIPTRTREPYPLPTLKMNPIFLANLEHNGLDEAINGQSNFELVNYKSHPKIEAPLSN